MREDKLDNIFTDKEYIDNGGNKCPFCKSSDIESKGRIQADSTTAWQGIRCFSCGKEWTDLYQLVGFEERKEDNVVR